MVLIFLGWREVSVHRTLLMLSLYVVLTVVARVGATFAKHVRSSRLLGSGIPHAGQRLSSPPEMRLRRT